LGRELGKKENGTGKGEKGGEEERKGRRELELDLPSWLEGTVKRGKKHNKHIKRPKVFGCAQIISLLKTEQNHLT
jgi:hypothetical protein